MVLLYLSYVSEKIHHLINVGAAGSPLFSEKIHGPAEETAPCPEICGAPFRVTREGTGQARLRALLWREEPMA